MKKSVIKIILCLSFSVVFSCLSPIAVFAETQDDDNNDYIEYHNQINFNDIDYAIRNSKELTFSVDKSKSPLKQKKAEKDIKILNEYFDKNPQSEKDLIDELSDDELVVISYTSAPVVLVDDHYERVTYADAEAASKTKTGSTSSKGYFTMQTTITKTGTKNKAGEYKYNTLTKGYWSKMSSEGGSNYPASGLDYIMQTVPKGMTISSDSLQAMYFYYIGSTDNYFGRAGKEYSRVNGNNNFIEYSVKDDPAGLNQLNSVKLKTTTWGKPSSSTRKINSYYVHTWKSLSVSVSVSGSSSKEVSLSITPSIKDKSWKLYNYVTFNF